MAPGLIVLRGIRHLQGAFLYQASHRQSENHARQDCRLCKGYRERRWVGRFRSLTAHGPVVRIITSPPEKHCFKVIPWSKLTQWKTLWPTQNCKGSRAARLEECELCCTGRSAISIVSTVVVRRLIERRRRCAHDTLSTMRQRLHDLMLTTFQGVSQCHVKNPVFRNCLSDGHMENNRIWLQRSTQARRTGERTSLQFTCMAPEPMLLTQQG